MYGKVGVGRVGLKVNDRLAIVGDRKRPRRACGSEGVKMMRSRDAIRRGVRE